MRQRPAGDPACRATASTARWGREDGGGMGTVYGEPVPVQARDDGRPARFVWRSRLYTVRAILEHWVISRETWRDRPEAGHDGARLRIAQGSRHQCLDPAPGQRLSTAPWTASPVLRTWCCV